MPKTEDENPSIISIPPFHYIHVHNNNKNVTHVVVGPLRFTRKDEESIVMPPTRMLNLPPRHYVIIKDPVILDECGQPLMDAKSGQIKVRLGDSEVRLYKDYSEPFPLYPQEQQIGEISELEVIREDTALRLRAIRDTIDNKGVARTAGEEWMFYGRDTYVPSVKIERVELVEATVVQRGNALRIAARRDCIDQLGVERKAGEQWLWRKTGCYMPNIDEILVEEVFAFVLTDKKALHLRAKKSFKDAYGIPRKAGQEWLVTNASGTETHLLDVYEELVQWSEIIKYITVSSREYCVVLDPYIEGVQQYGTKVLRRGECSFFLKPGESLEGGKKQDVIVLAEDEALLLKCTEGHESKSTEKSSIIKESGTDQEDEKGSESGSGIFVYNENTSDENDDQIHNTTVNDTHLRTTITDTNKSIMRKPGDTWMVFGPCDYIPPIQVEIVERRKKIPLDDNEGIYVRDTQTGHVRAVIGESYMLKPTEILWEKDLPNDVEELLYKQKSGKSIAEVPDYDHANKNKKLSDEDEDYIEMLISNEKQENQKKNCCRDKSRVVTFQVPHNAACQVYDYKAKKSRCCFGPDLIMLQPEEQFTILRLSGGKPKTPNKITSLTLMLGPDFMTDIVTVETSDHARLQLTLSYNWQFEIPNDADDTELNAVAAAIFSVRDFTGDACKAIASRVRGAVAAETFDHFHKFSAKIVRGSIFGVTPDGKIKDTLRFQNNMLVITNVDVQSVEPVDMRTRESLQKSVQLAIEITTNSQEARARQEAAREEEEAAGLLRQQRLKNEAANESTRMELLRMQAKSAAVEAEGKATSDARARASAAEFEAKVAVEMSRAKAQADALEAESRLQLKVQAQQAEVEHTRALNALEIEKAQKLAEIEAKKFSQLVNAIGADTITAMARAGPEMQAKLLQGLGLKGYLVTDGKSPINLFNTAQGMITPPTQ